MSSHLNKGEMLKTLAADAVTTVQLLMTKLMRDDRVTYICSKYKLPNHANSHTVRYDVIQCMFNKLKPMLIRLR